MSHDANDWWDRTIDRNRTALLRIVAAMFFSLPGRKFGGVAFYRRVL